LININNLSIIFFVKLFARIILFDSLMTVDDLHASVKDDNSLQPPILTVAELNQMARRVLELNLPLLWVQGELSNFTRAASGHWYFSLKDEVAQVRCTFFRNKNQFVDWRPENGLQVEIRGLPTLYEPRGDFQLNIEVMRRAGLGVLYEAFEKLKAKLEKEGLFDSKLKQPIPSFPTRLGVVTSTQTAALKDVLTTLRRRMPGIKVVIYSTPVQGKTAGPQIAESINIASRRNECDVIILCRGGGSIEDLWCFNDEVVARAIAACPIPIVSGVGHETDFTIADFVADLRAPTPTAAAEMCSPKQADCLAQLSGLAKQVQRNFAHQFETRSQHLDGFGRRLKHPSEYLSSRRASIAQLATRLRSSMHQTHERKQWHFHHVGMRMAHLLPDVKRAVADLRQMGASLNRAVANRLKAQALELDRTHSHLQHLNPQAVLERGYSITQDASGNVVRNSATLQAGEELSLRFAVGHARVIIESRS
jgi:exodeoxyribonuclease VII large subunit